jgi:hypothetical protein
MVPVCAWHWLRTGPGTKGTRHYDWAMPEATSDDTPGGHRIDQVASEQDDQLSKQATGLDAGQVIRWRS